MLLKEALDLFLLVDRARQTRETYRKFLSRFVAAIGPERPLELIRPEDLDAFVFQMREQKVKYADHPTRPAIQEPLAIATVYKNVKMIKAFFNWCERREYIQQSPARFLVNQHPKSRVGEKKAATDEEVDLMLAGVRFKPRDKAIILLLSKSACRAGDIANLRIANLDLENCKAWVEGKGGVERKIYFDEQAAQALRAWLAVRPKVTHDYVFTSITDRGPMTSPAVSQVVRRLSHLVEIRSLGSHSFRHRVATTFSRARVSPRVTQEYLGHSNIITTLRYYQDIDESDLFAAGALL